MTEPRMPERTRILRPALWVDSTSARLHPESFRIYLGLATCCDDDGWTLWRPDTLAAHLLRYQSVGRRLGMLAKAQAELVAAGLLDIRDCGCAYLPYLWRDFRQTGGNHSTTVADFHRSHASPDEYVLGGTSPASGSVSGSGSGMASEAPQTMKSGAEGDGPPNKPEPDPWTGWSEGWGPVRDAMVRRGYVRPPNGEADANGTQRDRLWQLVGENPSLVARLIDAAPSEYRAGQRQFYDLVGYLFGEWNALARARQ